MSLSDKHTVNADDGQISSPAALIDIGVNLGNSCFNDDLIDVLQRAQQANIGQCILTGTDLEESEKILALCGDYASEFPDMLFCTAGVHPHYAKSFNSETRNQLRFLAGHKSVVAIGEAGLDFNRNYSPVAAQEKAFEAQLELASELQLPIFMHERDAHQRQLEIIKAYRDSLSDGVIHCFTGDRTALFNYLDLDLHIGITGWICDERRGLELQRLVNNIPLQRLMLETDAPYLLPRTMLHKPKNRRNEPAYLPWVLKTVAENRDETENRIGEATTQTTQQFFNLPPLPPR
ncbi:MAG: TatD family hydrolase [Porticoccaceae bacterium]